MRHARNNETVTRDGRAMETSLEEPRRSLVTLRAIKRQRDSLELVKEFIDAVDRAVLGVVRNWYLGEERKFEL